ncbi:MAG: hypothetical protein AAFQ94_21725 [Bacteroidota bacterium]
MQDRLNAKKLPGNEDISFYSFIGEERYAILVLPQFEDRGKGVKLGLEVGAGGIYTIKIVTLENIGEDVHAILLTN